MLNYWQSKIICYNKEKSVSYDTHLEWVSIKNLFLLDGLSDNEKDIIIQKFEKPVLFKKGEIIYSEETFPNAIGVVISGKAAAVTNNSDTVYMKSFVAGSVFGVAAVFGNEEPYISTIIAKTDMEILFISESLLKEIFITTPLTSINYISFLTDRIRFLNKKLNMISCSSAEDTVYKYLCGIKDSENNVKIPVNMTLLSKMLGMGRATLYRSFDTLEKNGKITRENNIIKVI